jgi:hypothetical protein
MRLLREDVLGRDAFDPAFREYIRRWTFKHPQPADFFRTMENVSGRNLDWFWRGWVYTTARLDQAVDSVVGPAIPRPGTGARGQGSGNRGANMRGESPAPRTPDPGTRVFLSNRREMVMPVELKLTYDDGTSTVVTLPVEIWNLGSRFVFTAPGSKRVVGAEVDPRHVLPDVGRGNNAWPRTR